MSVSNSSASSPSGESMRSVLGQLLGDGQDAGPQPPVVGREEPEHGRQQGGGVRGVGVVVLAQDAVLAEAVLGMSARISSAVSRHSGSSSGIPRIPASLAARSRATQHISLDDT